MTSPWQPLLEWWFGTLESPNEIAADKGKLWFGKRDSHHRGNPTHVVVLFQRAFFACQ